MSANDKIHDERTIDLDAALPEALRAAYAPAPLEPSLNERLIESALRGGVAPNGIGVADAGLRDALADDAFPLGSAGPEKQAQAQLLADALADNVSHPLADLAEALRTAYAPSFPDVETCEATVQEALALVPPERKLVSYRRWSYPTITMAIAAGVALWVGRPPSPPTAEQKLVQSHSTAPLFAETFDQKTATERIDHIYAVRSRELRHNRYASWRVR